MSGKSRRQRVVTVFRPRCFFPGARSFADASNDSEVPPGFARALIVPEDVSTASCASAAGRMEVVTATGQRILFGADVDAAALARVVAALEAK